MLPIEDLSILRAHSGSARSAIRSWGRQLTPTDGSTDLNLQDLAILGEFVGGLVVLGSLLYLALQIRQNTQMLRTENSARGPERISQMQAALSQDAKLPSLQARAVSMPDEVWDRWAKAMKWWLSQPGIQAWWHARPVPFSTSSTAFVDDCLRDGRFDAEAAERWQRFVQGAPAAS